MVFLARFFCIRLPHLINIGILAAYFLFYPNIQAWPHRFVWWVWLPFFVYCWLGHFVSTLRYVTRGVAGAYLSKDGDRPDKNLVSLVQAELFPDATIPHMFFHSLITIVSFSLILLVQGWATALLAVVGWIIVDSAFSSFLPINSLNHLERIYKHSRLYVHRLARTGDPGMLKYGIFPWDVSDFIAVLSGYKSNKDSWL